ncbi:MAG: helix-turn-helix domain-containing protein [Bacteroidota bacterium]
MQANQFLFFFSAIGVFNAVLVCLYLFFVSKRKKTSHYLLATLLLLFCVRVGVSCIYFFQKNLSPHWIQLGLSANFLIGPILWSYIDLQLSKKELLRKVSQFQLFANAAFILIFGLCYTFQDNYQIWDSQIRYFIHCQLGVYLLLITFRLFPIFKRAITKKQALPINEYSVLLVFGITALICGGFVMSLYTNYILGPIFTSIVFYSLCLLIIFKRDFIKSSFFSPTKYSNKKIHPSVANRLTVQLEKLMREEQLYKNPLLKLEIVAKHLKISENQLSQLLNDNIGKSYATYVNGYRIQAAKEILAKNPRKKIEAIAYEVGYNAKASFFTTFKKQTGMTPTAYKRQLLRQ